jgi:hypothetical protein
MMLANSRIMVIQISNSGSMPAYLYHLLISIFYRRRHSVRSCLPPSNIVHGYHFEYYILFYIQSHYSKLACKYLYYLSAYIASSQGILEQRKHQANSPYRY